MLNRDDFKLDFDDRRTSFVERLIVYVLVTCGILSATFEGIQTIMLILGND